MAGFVVAQLVGGAVGLGLVLVLYPTQGRLLVTEKPTILFACRANAGRSVTGKVLAEYYARGRADVFSAGSEPGDHVHPEVAAVLADLGLDASSETPKAFDPDATYTAVITMGCGEACPFYPGARYEDWELDDPAGRPIEEVRPIRDEIRRRVEALVAELTPA